MNQFKIRLVKEKLNDYDGEKVLGPNDATDITKKIIEKEDREHFIVLCLSTKNEITGVHTVSIGTLNSAMVHPREVFKTAILSNAAGIIIGHNHPSGDVKPSKEDIQVTERLKKTGEIVGINLLDHIIIGDGSYSFAQHNKL